MKFIDKINRERVPCALIVGFGMFCEAEHEELHVVDIPIWRERYAAMEKLIEDSKSKPSDSTVSDREYAYAKWSLIATPAKAGAEGSQTRCTAGIPHSGLINGMPVLGIDMDGNL